MIPIIFTWCVIKIWKSNQIQKINTGILMVQFLSKTRKHDLVLYLKVSFRPIMKLNMQYFCSALHIPCCFYSESVDKYWYNHRTQSLLEGWWLQGLYQMRQGDPTFFQFCYVPTWIFQNMFSFPRDMLVTHIYTYGKRPYHISVSSHLKLWYVSVYEGINALET